MGRFHWAAELFVHYQIQYAVAAAILGAGFVLLKSWRGVLVCVFLLISPAWRIGSLYRGGPAGDGEQQLRVVTYNVLGVNDGHAAVIDWLGQVDADVIYLCETNDGWLRSLSELHSRYPHRVEEGGLLNRGYCLLSRFPVEEVRQLQMDGPIVKVRLLTPGGHLTVVGTHPMPPTRRRLAALNRACLRAAIQQAVEAEDPVLLVGDLNASRWAHALRPLFEAGFRDTSEGFGYQATWMRHTGVLAIPIDHVFSRGLGVPVDRRVGPAMGSDHSPVIVDFPGWGGNS
ncbi:endonuclease/exonuclease/phosphatase family protein [Haloferula rosea]|uniref:Endonuclease/exonuclease/phosphatase family protein n=1 Tax=Haloferula rosea TaxID=490093 RepID=A0A934RCE2_9BACT|nr:endonuclease/exonuclease/phosphatase family protein [Haloferula rosea]MBK1827022.1 endonuclease/exonuclease/phosphatase family protein [Haloferula rosea]